MEREIVFARNVEVYLTELMHILFEKGYFSFPDSAKQYVAALVLYIQQNLGIVQSRIAPDYFNRFGKNMRYILPIVQIKTQRGMFSIKNMKIFFLLDIFQIIMFRQSISK
jgi:hypothetical protein